MNLKTLIAAAVAAGSLTASASAQSIELRQVVTGLSDPVLAIGAGDGTNRLFIVEQVGRISILLSDGTTPSFLDISAKVLCCGEQGLLGAAFHPQYETNRRFFVNYTRRGDGATVISEFAASPSNPNTAHPGVLNANETILMTIPQPFSNHNGGMLAFGPDGYLYIAMGDGGSGNDPQNNAQLVDNSDRALLGKILRIDVDNPAGGLPYSSPADNPYAGATVGRDEIYAIGFRNPWRMSFDRTTGTLWVGDVGQNAREEVHVVSRGGNYGWRVYEGTLCTNIDPALCNPANFVPPVYEYAQGTGRCAIIGGYAYRGPWQTLAAGDYVFGDLCTGEIFAYRDGSASVLLDTTISLRSFGEDDDGELYAVGVTTAGGTVFKIRAPVALTAPSGPTLGGATETFAWTAGSGVLRYWLYVGTSVGGSDIYNAAQGTNRSVTVSGLPTDGRTVYVRLYFNIDEQWEFRDYTFTAATARPAAIFSPSSASTLQSSLATIMWSGGVGVSSYWLYVGRTRGGNDVYDSPEGTNTSRTLSNLPITGAPLYMRIYSKIGDTWHFADHVVQTQPTPAAIVSPTPGSTLSGSSVSVSWTIGGGVSDYWLSLGRAQGGYEVYSQYQGTALSTTVAGIPIDGGPIWMRLYSRISGAWQFRDYAYTARSPGGQITSPTPGSQLAGSSVTFSWTTGPGIDRFWLYVGSSRGGNDLYDAPQGSNTSQNVTGLPTDGRTIWVRLYSHTASGWTFVDYSYRAAGGI